MSEYLEDADQFPPKNEYEPDDPEPDWLDHSVDCCCGDNACPGSHPEIFPKRD